MSWYELWLFLHIAAAIVWIGGAAAIQVFGILTKRAADPAKTAFFAQNVSFTVMRVFLPAALVVLASGVGVTVNGDWDWGEPFISAGLLLWGSSRSSPSATSAGRSAAPAPSSPPRGRAPRSRCGSGTSSGSPGSCSACSSWSSS